MKSKKETKEVVKEPKTKKKVELPKNINDLPSHVNPSEIKVGEWAKYEWKGKLKKDGSDEREDSTFQLVKIVKIDSDTYKDIVFINWNFVDENGDQKSKIFQTLVRKDRTKEGVWFWVEGITRTEVIWRSLIYNNKRKSK